MPDGVRKVLNDRLLADKSRYARARKEGYRSGLEVAVAKDLDNRGCPFFYEPGRIPFTEPAKQRTYTPDIILPNGIVVELKGEFKAADRTKHKLLKIQYPWLDVRFVFSRSKQKLGKKSTTTYGMWCDKNGFLFADCRVPEEWIVEAADDDYLTQLAGIIRGLEPTEAEEIFRSQRNP